MLVKERILPFDENARRVGGVTFCECDEKIMPQMQDLVGAPESGFLARLEDLVLFEDTNITATMATEEAIARHLRRHGEKIKPVVRLAIEKKRAHLSFRTLFPFDFLNLDFCAQYYSKPPDILKIHKTIEKMLEWQRRPGQLDDGKTEFSVDNFVAAITCRLDKELPSTASARLKEIVKDNAARHPTYQQAISGREGGDVNKWSKREPLDFFMAAWPKEIARLAWEKSWDIKIHEHVCYTRRSDKGKDYHMVCLIAEFNNVAKNTTYLKAVEQCLDPKMRVPLEVFQPDKGEGKLLLNDLREITRLRNVQAKIKGLETLPDPRAEILKLRKIGVPI